MRNNLENGLLTEELSPMKTLSTSECFSTYFDMLLFWSSKVGADSSECGGILIVQSEDQQAEHSDVLKSVFILIELSAC